MLGEFEFIRKMQAVHGLGRLGDDGAVLPKDDQTDLVVTADLLVEDIDFRLDWTTPEYLGHKSLAVSLSDIAAMGAEPTSALLSLGVPDAVWNSDFLERFYAGWHDLAGKYGVELVGGDVSRSSDALFIDSIVLGNVTRGRAILRSGAKDGDGVFVAGTLGGAAGGLARLEAGARVGGDTSKEEICLLEKQLKPSPQLAVAKLLQEHHLATSAIDISDGLSSDLHHICQASRVGALINAGVLPFEPTLTRFFGRDKCVQMALNGGEDFALLFTGNKQEISAADLPQVTCIGEVSSNIEIIELIGDNERTRITPKGYRHF